MDELTPKQAAQVRLIAATEIHRRQGLVRRDYSRGGSHDPAGGQRSTTPVFGKSPQETSSSYRPGEWKRESLSAAVLSTAASAARKAAEACRKARAAGKRINYYDTFQRFLEQEPNRPFFEDRGEASVYAAEMVTASRKEGERLTFEQAMGLAYGTTPPVMPTRYQKQQYARKSPAEKRAIASDLAREATLRRRRNGETGLTFTTVFNEILAGM